MQAPAITRQRRPFLAPIWLGGFFAVALLGMAFAAWRSAMTTTVVVVRHAEKAFGTIEDPPLSQRGEERAVALARLLGAGRIEAVYVTEARRTQQTAAPLLARLGLRGTVVPAGEVEGIAGRVLREHRGGAVLVVGHAHALPGLVRSLSGVVEGPMVAEDEYDNLYIVSVPTFGKAGVLRLKY